MSDRDTSCWHPKKGKKQRIVGRSQSLRASSQSDSRKAIGDSKRTHRQQEANRAPVNLDVRQEVRIALEQAQCRKVGFVEVLEKEWFAVEGVDRTAVVADQSKRTGERVRMGGTTSRVPAEQPAS